MWKLIATVLMVMTATAPMARAQLGPMGTQVWSQDSPGIPVGLEAGAGVGVALAAGDFNCDGIEDLAIGMPGEDLVQGDDAGRVLVMFGTATGLSTTDSQVWGQNSPVLLGTAEEGDEFGTVLAAGDFDHDGCSDLVVGSPEDTIAGNPAAGSVNVIYGSVDGLTGDQDQLLHQDVGDLAGSPEWFDRFGSALAVGDFNNDGVDDLAIGVPGENFEGQATGGGTIVTAGRVHVLLGTLFGLQTIGTHTFARNLNIQGSPESLDAFGATLAAGDFNGALGDELAIGVPGATVAGDDQAGMVVLVTSVTNLVLDSVWSQDSAGVPGSPDADDRFGDALASGDFDGDGFDELVVGVPSESRESPSVPVIGAVNILNFVTANHVIFTQDDLSPEQAESQDAFGSALAVGDFNADGVDDLAVGAASEDLGPLTNAGIVHVVHGLAGGGLNLADRQSWIQTINPPETGDRFGAALATGRFTGRSGDDLAVGVPGESIGSASETGAFNIIYSTVLFVDGFESASHDQWTSVVDG